MLAALPEASTIVVHHLKISSARPVRQTHERLLDTLPRLDPKLTERLRRGNPSDLFGQVADDRVTEAGRELDRELETALRRACEE